MDEAGFCQFASVGNLAQRAIVPIDKAKEAVTILEAPDENSSDPSNEGRRIERVNGGWMVINAPKYRDLITRAIAQEKTRQRVAAFRARKKQESNSNGHVTESNVSVTQSETVSESESEEKTTPKPPSVTNSNGHVTAKQKAIGGPAALPPDGIDKHMAAKKLMEKCRLNDRWCFPVMVKAIENFCAHIPNAIPSQAPDAISALWSEFSAANIPAKCSARTWFADSDNFLIPDQKWRKKPKAEKPAVMKPQNGTPYKTPAWAFERKV